MVEYTYRYTILGYYWFLWLCKLTYVKLQLKMERYCPCSYLLFVL